MYEQINDKGQVALRDVPIPNLQLMTEFEFKTHLQGMKLTNGSQFLSFGEAGLRKMSQNFIHWGINSNALARDALRFNPKKLRQFPNGMQSGHDHDMYSLALMFSNLYGLADDLEELEKQAKQAKQASEGGGKRRRSDA